MKTVIFAGLLGVLGVMMTSVGSGNNSWAQSAPEVWQVEIDIYSGMPNPVITLTAEEMAQAKDRLGRARAVTTAAATNVTTVRPSRAGYRGVLIRGKGADKQVSMDAELSLGKILRRGPSARAMLDDSGINLERYLIGLAVAKQALPAEVGEALLKLVP